MFHAPENKYKRLPDETTHFGDDFQAPTPPIPLKTFDKTIPSTAYVSISPYEPDQLNHPMQEHPYEVHWYNVTGWRSGAMLSALLATISLLLNISVAIWASRQYGTGSALVEVFNGDCKDVQKINTWIHLGINAMSTGLLSGSNYCMQCLSAPTRKDVDKAHAKGRRLDIGIPSVRNLQTISKKKVCLWWLLGLSSIPLHLMYNSAFFSSLETNDYNILYVAEDFVNGASFNITQANLAIDFRAVQSNLSHYETLQNAGCIEAYAVDFITDRRTLVLVTNNSSQDSSILDTDAYFFEDLYGDFAYDPYSWICSDPNLANKITVPTSQLDGYEGPYCYEYVSSVVADARQWAPGGYAVNYCLSERVAGTCGLNLNLIIIAVVAICNFGKVIGMIFVAFWIHDDPLITVGDAIESFLVTPDNSTKGRCLTTKRKEVSLSEKARTTSQRRHAIPSPEVWQPVRQRWFRAASKQRWALCISLFVTALIVIGVLLGRAVSSLPNSKSVKALWGYGFGTVHPQALISGWAISNLTNPNTQILASVLIANLPQSLLSFLYLTLNGLCTSMFLADEWSRFGRHRKPLRTSTPKPGQRKTYFLQLPYRIALPLMAMSGLLHWLVSQSIFLAVVAQYDPDGSLYDPVAIATCGFSPFAMICVLIAGCVIILLTIGIGYRRFDGSMPLVTSCSAAISAACHAPSWDQHASTQAVQWGSVKSMVSSDGIGHCCFSSGPVEEPVAGQKYAGAPQIFSEIASPE